MNDVPFHQTGLGRDLLERHVPALVRELTRLNDTLAKLVEQNETVRHEPQAKETEQL
jgi:hypothetical protein